MKSIRDIITKAELFSWNVQLKVATKPLYINKESPNIVVKGKGLIRDIMINGRKKVTNLQPIESIRRALLYRVPIYLRRPVSTEGEGEESSLSLVKYTRSSSFLKQDISTGQIFKSRGG